MVRKTSFEKLCSSFLFLSNTAKGLILGSERGILPSDVDKHVQLVQFGTLCLTVADNISFHFDIQSEMRPLNVFVCSLGRNIFSHRRFSFLASSSTQCLVPYYSIGRIQRLVFE